MFSRTKRTSLAAAVAMLVALAGAPSGHAAETQRPMPSETEQTGMSWVEYFQCVRTVQSQMGNWSYAAQQCEDQKPQNTPEPPVRTPARAPARAESAGR